MISRYTALPFYGNMFSKAGFAAEVKTIREALDAKQIQKAEQAILPRMINALAMLGSFTAFGPTIEHFQDIGVKVVLYPNGVSSDQPAAWYEGDPDVN